MPNATKDAAGIQVATDIILGNLSIMKYNKSNCDMS